MAMAEVPDGLFDFVRTICTVRPQAKYLHSVTTTNLAGSSVCADTKLKGCSPGPDTTCLLHGSVTNADTLHSNLAEVPRPDHADAVPVRVDMHTLASRQAAPNEALSGSGLTTNAMCSCLLPRSVLTLA